MLNQAAPPTPEPVKSRTRSYLGPAQARTLRCIMLLLWIVWAVVTTALLALLAYRGTLTRYEEDQLFLDPASGHQQQEQTQIMEKVNKIQPIVRIMMGAT